MSAACPRKLLVVANETLQGEELLDAVRRHVGGHDARRLVRVHQQQGTAGVARIRQRSQVGADAGREIDVGGGHQRGALVDRCRDRLDRHGDPVR